MSIATDVSRIKGNITAALDAIADKGVTVPDGSTSDALAGLIASIEAGGGGGDDPDDGTTRIYIHLEDGRTSPVLGLTLNKESAVTVDWGDGTSPDVVENTSITSKAIYTPHDYAASGDYTIKIAHDATIWFSGNSNTQYPYIFTYDGSNDGRIYYYRNAIKKIVMKNDSRVDKYAFYSCNAMTSIELSESVTYVGEYSFCNCYSLSHIVFPSGLTTINANALRNCFGMKYYDFTALTSVPTLSATSAISGIRPDCEIRVPAALVEEWKAATNWSTYADYIVGV